MLKRRNVCVEPEASPLGDAGNKPTLDLSIPEIVEVGVRPV